MLLQIKSILTNKTHVETKLLEEIFKWKLENKKLLRSDLSWPFDLGLKENIKQVVTTTGWPPGDGIDWQGWSEKNENNKNKSISFFQVRDGADQNWVSKQIKTMLETAKKQEGKKNK